MKARLWLSYCSTIRPDMEAAQLSLLSGDERRRYGAFRRPERRRQFLAGRLLLRRLLSAAFDRSIEAWRFEEQPGLPPRLLTDTPGPIAFSLSHSRELVACLLAPGECVGVDVEFAGKQRDFLAIAAALYPAEWVRCLERLPPEERRIEFYRYWTLYEAVLKAGAGTGLASAPPLAVASACLGAYCVAIALPSGAPLPIPPLLFHPETDSTRATDIVWACVDSPLPLGDSSALLSMGERCQSESRGSASRNPIGNR